MKNEWRSIAEMVLGFPGCIDKRIITITTGQKGLTDTCVFCFVSLVLLAVHLFGQVTGDGKFETRQCNGVVVGAPHEKDDCKNVKDEENNAAGKRPDKDDVKQEEREESKARLPRVEANVIILLFEHEEENACHGTKEVGKRSLNTERHIEASAARVV